MGSLLTTNVRQLEELKEIHESSNASVSSTHTELNLSHIIIHMH